MISQLLSIGTSLRFIFAVGVLLGVARHLLAKSPDKPSPATANPSTAADETSSDGAGQGDLEDVDDAPGVDVWWMPVLRFPLDSDEGSPSAEYAEVWQPQWQEELRLTAEQKEKLEAIGKQARAASDQLREKLLRLSAEERQAAIKSWGGKPPPEVRKLASHVRRQVEDVLTAEQRKALQDYQQPRIAIAMICRRAVRRELAFTPQQDDQLHQLAAERLSRFQQVNLERADKTWDLLTAEQRDKIPELVRRQGPTSAVLSLAADLGFNMDVALLGYPMLAAEPVRKRLKLAAGQEQRFQDLWAAAIAKNQEVDDLQEKPEANPASAQALEKLLTAEQLEQLKQIDLCRAMVLALSYPEKRDSLGISKEQQAALEKLAAETHQLHYQIDSEMIEKAMKIPTAEQLEKLRQQMAADPG